MAEPIKIAGIVVPEVATLAAPIVRLLTEKSKSKGGISLADLHEVLNYGIEWLLDPQMDKVVSSYIIQKYHSEVYKLWKGRVSNIERDVAALNTEYDELRGKIWHIFRRQSLKENIKRALSEVIKLVEECPEEIVVKEIDVQPIEEYPTLQKAFQEVLSLLQHNEVQCVALYGEEGVGKITFMQHLSNHFYDNSVDSKLQFDMVIFIKVEDGDEDPWDIIDEDPGDIIGDEDPGDIIGDEDPWDIIGGGLRILQKIADRIRVVSEGSAFAFEVARRVKEALVDKRYLLILHGIQHAHTIERIWRWLAISKDERDSKVVITSHRNLNWRSGYVDRKVELRPLSRTEKWKMFRHIVGHNHLPPTAQPASPVEGESSSKSTNTIGKPKLLQDMSSLMRIRDFIHLMLSYPMRIGYEHFLEQRIDDVNRCFECDDFDSLRRRVEYFLSESPMRYVQALIPEDITKEIIHGSLSTETSLKQVPQPILLLATDLALDQLILSLTSYTRPYSRFKILTIRFSIRNDAEKTAVAVHIKADSRICAAFDNIQIIDLNQNDDETKRELELAASAESLTKGDLVVVVDGDGDKKADPLSLSLAINDSKNVVLFITTLSSDDFLTNFVDLTIKTEYHLLPWELFCRIIGSEILDSSNDIQEIAMQIVVKCRGHLLATILMAKSLKHAKNVQIWELALKKLLYRGREAIVNAFFFNIIWANVISEREKVRLIRCLMVFKSQDYWKMSHDHLFDRLFSKQLVDTGDLSDDQLCDHWFSKQLVDTGEEAKGILQDFIECSILLQFEDTRGQHILLPEDIIFLVHAFGEEIPDNLSEEALESTISNLQVLNLSNTHMRHLYDVKTQPQLEKLNLDGSILETLPEAIFKLQKLETLSLEHCSQLLRLPPQISKLENLKELCLAGCTRLETLPQEIWELPKLQTLNLPGTSIFPTSENEELINSNDLPLSFIYHEHSGRGKKDDFKLKLKVHGRFKQFEKFCLPIMLFEIPNLEKCDLSGTHITDLPPSLNLPNLTTLLLGNNLNLMKIPSSFFDHVPQLKVLDLSHTSIHELPSSVFRLRKLEELYLKDCELFVQLSAEVKRLENLRTLDLDGTLITHLPWEIKGLTNLKNLSLSFYNDNNHDSRFHVIPYGVLTQLTWLEVLRINVNSDNEWWIENIDGVLQQISTLSKLRVLDVYIPKVGFKASIKKSLSNFRFIMGKHKPRMISRVPPAIEVIFKERGRSLKFVNGKEDFPDKVKSFLSRANAFFLDRHMTIEYLNQFGLENLEKLRLCILAECNEMQSIVNDSDSKESFCMQFLTIFYMKNLTSVINKPTLGNSIFHELKLLALHTCPELTTIFTMHFLNSLVNLEELIVEDCPKVSSIISCTDSKPTEDFFLPRLRKLSLLFVPGLDSISNGVRFGSNLEQMGLYYCPNLKTLSTAELSSQKLKVIRGESKWWEALKWNEAEWGQEDPRHKFSKIFSAFDEDLDILTQLTPYELMISFNRENDSE